MSISSEKEDYYYYHYYGRKMDLCVLVPVPHSVLT